MKRGRGPRSIHRPVAHRAPSALLCATIIAHLTGCTTSVAPGTLPSPFRGLAALPLDGVQRRLDGNIASLGAFEAADVLRVRVQGPDVQSVLLLRAEVSNPEQAFLAGGGPAGTFFEYPVQLPGHYFLFVERAPGLTAAETDTTLEALPGDPTRTAPTRQYVRVIFEDDFLSAPGMFDPVDGTADDLALLQALQPVVRDGVLDRLRTIHADTPIVILGPDDPEPGSPTSVLTFAPDRVEAADQDFVDAAFPPPDPTRPQCQVRVVFGEVLPSGTRQNAGNTVLDDAAVVYVGSFQGRGMACWTAASNAVSSMTLTLAQTGAHEIGHLVGLYHVEQINLMNRTATLAFLRELDLERGQVQLDRFRDGQIVGEVFPAIIQDPAMYFSAVFSTE